VLIRGLILPETAQAASGVQAAPTASRRTCVRIGPDSVPITLLRALAEPVRESGMIMNRLVRAGLAALLTQRG